MDRYSSPAVGKSVVTGKKGWAQREGEWWETVCRSLGRALPREATGLGQQAVSLESGAESEPQDKRAGLVSLRLC